MLGSSPLPVMESTMYTDPLKWSILGSLQAWPVTQTPAPSLKSVLQVDKNKRGVGVKGHHLHPVSPETTQHPGRLDSLPAFPGLT